MNKRIRKKRAKQAIIQAGLVVSSMLLRTLYDERFKPRRARVLTAAQDGESYRYSWLTFGVPAMTDAITITVD